MDLHISCNSTKLGTRLQAQGCSSGSGLLHVSLIFTGPVASWGHVATRWMAGAQEDKWKHMMPLESSSMVLACCHLYPHFIGQHKSHGQRQWPGKIYSAYYRWCYCEVTWQRKWLLKLSGHEELRTTIHSTTVHSFVYCLHPSHVQNILTLM